MGVKKIDYIGMAKPMVDGDAALFRLAQRRFAQLGLGVEIYPAGPEHLRELSVFFPEGAVNTVHLPYHYNLTNPEHFAEIAACAQIGGVRGFTLHEYKYAAAPEAFKDAARRLSAVLQKAPGRPAVFLEFVGGLDGYTEALKLVHGIPLICPCLDAGHIAVEHCQARLRRRFPELDQKLLSPDFPGLEKYIAGIQEAVRGALDDALDSIRGFLDMGWEKVHFHCHNIHPLSKFSPYPIRDHLSFLKQIPLPFAFNGRKVVDGVYNIAGARRLHALLADAARDNDLSLMLEIHRQPGHLPLGADADLFSHWADLENAEAMNYHLELIAQCYNVLMA